MVKVQSSSPVSAFQVYAKKTKKKKSKEKKSHLHKIKTAKHIDDDVIEVIEPSLESIVEPATSTAFEDNNEFVTDINQKSSKKNKKQKKRKKQQNSEDKSPDGNLSEQTNGGNGSIGKKHRKVSITSTISGQLSSVLSGSLDSMSSIERGKSFLAYLIAPLTVEEFKESFWEKRPLVVNREVPDYYDRLEVNTGTLDAMLRNNNLRYTKNVDITSYKDGKRETHNQAGRALPAEVWDFFNNDGCSVRWLNPQTFSQRLCAFCAGLQEYFGCFVGANAYLTPPASQGFAPHYDDIEAFIVQLEGRKHWRLYKPKEGDVLARTSSRNFEQAEVGAPFLEVALSAGDVLYFPRGTIHQAVARDEHSLHVTLSCYQRNSWADLLEQLLPAALSKAISEDSSLRSGLPVGHLSHVGAANADLATAARAGFMSAARQMLDRVLGHVDVDAAVDKLAKRFMEDALPPVLTDAERKCSVFDDGDRMLPGGKVVNSWAMDDETMVRLVRAHCVRLVFEDGKPRLYHTQDNTREYHEEEPGFFELTPDMVPSVKTLIQAYPDFIPVGALPLGSLQEQVELCGQLWLKGVLLTKEPLAE